MKEVIIKEDNERSQFRKTILEDDQYFAAQLDLIPRKFLIPLSDEQKEERFEKQQQRTKEKKKKKRQQTEEEQKPQQPATKRKRIFNGVISNAEAIAEATRRQEETNKEIAKEYLKNETLVPIRKTVDDASLSELRARLQSKIEAERAKNGVPGARAERDKLLPPRPPRVVSDDKRKKALDNEEADKPEEKNSDEAQKKKKEELEARISYGALKLDEEKNKNLDKPERSATSTRSIINVKKLIKQAQESQARVEALKAQGKEDVVKMERWDTLEKKAAGEKVRDDPQLLKKALKRLEKKKVKSAHEWQERKHKEGEEKKGKSDQRQKNIMDRKAKKIEKRGGAVQKKDEAKEKRRRPGFEGTNTPIKKSKGHDNSAKQDFKKRQSSPEGGGKSPFGGKKAKMAAES